MRKIYIGFSKSRKKLAFFSWLIRLWENTKYSHAYVIFPLEKYDTNLIYQASGSMVNFMGEKAFMEKHKPVYMYEVIIDENAYYRAMDYSIKHAGYKYAFKQIIGIMFMRFAKWFGKKISNPFDGKGYICTELVAEIVNNLEVSDVSISTEDVGLKELHAIVKQLNVAGKLLDRK